MSAKRNIYYLAGFDLSHALSSQMLSHWELIPLETENEIENREDVLIVDTYSLGLDFLDRVLRHVRVRGKVRTPVLVIDAYTEEIFIRKILEKGATGYLHVDDISDRLDESIKELVLRHNLGDDGLVPEANVEGRVNREVG